MAGKLPKDSLVLGTEIAKAETRVIESADGKRFEGRAVVLATDIDPANRLLGIENKLGQWNAVDCLYFSLPEDQLPTSEPILHLDGTGQGPVNNLTFVSTLCDCAPSGRALASTSVIGRQETEHEELAQEVLGQLGTWFGEGIEWEFVKGYRIRQLGACLSRCHRARSSGQRSPSLRGLFRSALDRCRDRLGAKQPNGSSGSIPTSSSDPARFENGL